MHAATAGAGRASAAARAVSFRVDFIVASPWIVSAPAPVAASCPIKRTARAKVPPRGECCVVLDLNHRIARTG